MTIDYSHLLSVSLGFLIGVILKTILDFNLGVFIVKNFHWIRVRSIFRTDPNKLKGVWTQLWDLGTSTAFPKDLDRHSSITIKQLGHYCYGVFHSKNKAYVVFGQIKHDYFYGHWYDKKDKMGYFGTFELKIIDSSTLSGRWMGHSKQSNEIRSDRWEWSKTNGE